jgi:hypothetical protein
MEEQKHCSGSTPFKEKSCVPLKSQDEHGHLSSNVKQVQSRKEHEVCGLQGCPKCSHNKAMVPPLPSVPRDLLREYRRSVLLRLKGPGNNSLFPIAKERPCLISW